MDHASHNKIVSFIWSIADDYLRDVYVHGKYPDLILPMFVLRRLDCLLEANFKLYLDGFSDNVKEITDKFRFRSEVVKMNKS